MTLLEIQRNFRAINKGLSIKSTSNFTKKLNKKNILLIGMVDSPHFHKWISAILCEFPKKKILIYPSDRPHLHDKSFKAILRKNKSIKIFKFTPFHKLNFIIYYSLDLVIGIRWRAYLLAKFVIFYKPAILHFHEMQHGAYIYNLIFNGKKIPINSRKIISTWGSDLILYSSVDSQRAQINTCLNWADLLTAEREEELEDAKKFGFNGEFRAPLYITLGAKVDENTELAVPSSRKIILIKGHQSNTGRALNALHVISQVKEALEEFEILVYSAAEPVKIQVDILRNTYKININTIENLSNAQMLALFKRARVSISLAISDGLPGVLVEAMQSGTFPIQSENSAAKDFLVNGTNGFIVDPWNFDSIRDSLLRAVSDDQLVDNALFVNRIILKKKYNYDDGVKKLRELYL